MTARVVQPVSIGLDRVLASNAVELYANYNPATTYALYARVVSGALVYESLGNDNIGNSPATMPTAWWPLGPSNKAAMFDNQISTGTVAANNLTVTVATGPINSVGFFGLVGATLDVTVRNGLAGEIVYSRTVTLDATVIADWYQYFFEPSVRMGEVILTDIPPYFNAHVTATVYDPVADVGLGLMTAGTFYTIGDTQYGASVGITDYSRKETDEFGVTSFIKRDYSKRMSIRVMLPNAQLNKVQKVLASLRATPCAWLGSDQAEYSPLVVFGYYKDFSIDVSYPTHSLCSLEIEGLT